ncbi:predicted protein [Histoplasma mississippiense (nom. inval.)]|uniref:predicted protein n=1 Tax=Ajellomyces capsulatus (strain NAm1 / WU24) TaxID=2059318 RepID=UPI000157C3A9|nr:predicted protein [Histoplasma mississippiense (nom. inval.)]EDN07286.1 predicted protein [Histoplasma mississippiense (nom. inval.)]
MYRAVLRGDNIVATTSQLVLDPMVPYGNNALVDPDDATLEKLAADAAGKELVFGQ